MNIDIVTTCVNYSDILSISLKENIKKIKIPYRFHIITTDNDKSTIDLCLSYNINPYITQDFFTHGSTFNKGAALNSLFKYIYNKYNDLNWILKLDADILFHDAINNFIDGLYNNNIILYDNSSLNNNYDSYLYTCARNIYNSPIDLQKNHYFHEKPDWIGYFQLFHFNKIKDTLFKRHNIFYEYHNACRYDDMFRDRYWPNKNDKKYLQDSVTHLGPIAKNWDGRVSEKWC